MAGLSGAGVRSSAVISTSSVAAALSASLLFREPAPACRFGSGRPAALSRLVRRVGLAAAALPRRPGFLLAMTIGASDRCLSSCTRPLYSFVHLDATTRMGSSRPHL